MQLSQYRQSAAVVPLCLPTTIFGTYLLIEDDDRGTLIRTNEAFHYYPNLDQKLKSQVVKRNDYLANCRDACVIPEYS